MHEMIQKRIRLINGIGTLVVVAGLVLPAGVGALMLWNRGERHIRQSAKLRSSLSELDGLSKTLEQVQKELKQNQQRLADAEKQLPSSDAMDNFMVQLAKVAEKAGLQVEAITPDKETTDSGGYKALPVAISGSGDWKTCYRFLAGLRSMDRLTRLDKVTLESHADMNRQLASADPDCRIEVSISTFMAR